ncbi:MAG TPA: DUF47 family protein [Candidatus Bathyarchaeia archaeon]|nr:DUF47 family protein [Candidatus Bathyarchaeia archaeon]
MFSRFKELLVIGEGTIFREMTEMIAIARKANAIMIETLTQADRSDLALNVEQIKLFEKRSDELAFKLKAHIMNGAVSPTVIDNMLSCVEIADSVIDHYYIASRELWRMANVEFDTEDDERNVELDSALVIMLENASYAISILEKLLAATNMVETMKRRREIERVEEETDNIKDRAFDKLYAFAPKMHYLRFTHYSELLHNFDDIVDGCEDLSDLFVSVISSISR